MIGPTRPGAASTSTQGGVAAGPSLPPHLQNRQNAHLDEDDDEDDDGYTPALPPSMASRTAQGPSLPPHLASKAAPQSESSDSEDDVGPRPPPAAGAGPSLTAAEEFRLREKQKQDEEAERKRLEGLKPKREEWMLVPPSSLDIMASTDPTKLKTRGFAQNTRRGGAAGKASEDGIALWTETPEERAKRQDDEVLGKRKRVENAAKQETDAERAARLVRQNRDAEMRSHVEAYNVSRRQIC